MWAEYHPALFSSSLDDFLARLAALGNACTCIPVTGDLAALLRLARGEGSVPALALKGSEAAGLVGSETAGILYPTLEAERRRLGSGPQVILWGGLATPEAAAACLTSGAGGVVFESLHWLTDQVSLPEDRRRKLDALKPDFTSVVGSALGAPCRFFDKGNSLAVKELPHLAQTLAGSEAAEESRRAFARRVIETSVPALESSFGREELIPLGPEAAFAAGPPGAAL